MSFWWLRPETSEKKKHFGGEFNVFFSFPLFQNLEPPAFRHFLVDPGGRNEIIFDPPLGRGLFSLNPGGTAKWKKFRPLAADPKKVTFRHFLAVFGHFPEKGPKRALLGLKTGDSLPEIGRNRAKKGVFSCFLTFFLFFFALFLKIYFRDLKFTEFIAPKSPPLSAPWEAFFGLSASGMAFRK